MKLVVKVIFVLAMLLVNACGAQIVPVATPTASATEDLRLSQAATLLSGTSVPQRELCKGADAVVTLMMGAQRNEYIKFARTTVNGEVGVLYVPMSSVVIVFTLESGKITPLRAIEYPIVIPIDKDTNLSIIMDEGGNATITCE